MLLIIQIFLFTSNILTLFKFYTVVQFNKSICYCNLGDNKDEKIKFRLIF